jgi:hypothetical protein
MVCYTKLLTPTERIIYELQINLVDCLCRLCFLCCFIVRFLCLLPHTTFLADDIQRKLLTMLMLIWMFSFQSKQNTHDQSYVCLSYEGCSLRLLLRRNAFYWSTSCFPLASDEIHTFTVVIIYHLFSTFHTKKCDGIVTHERADPLQANRKQRR